jgi:hypothetical protein
VSGRRVAVRAALCALMLAWCAPRGAAAREDVLPGWFDLEIPGGAATLEALNLSMDERAFTLPILARVLHDRDQQARFTAALPRLRAAMTSSDDAIAIPAPLSTAVWRDILPPVKPPASTDLFSRLVSDRLALLTAAGLMATTDSVRAWLTRDRDLLRFIYQQGAAPFAVVSRRLQIDDNHIVVPGGPQAEAAWQSLTGESPGRPAAFLRALLTKDNGRLAWYYDAVGGFTKEQLAAAWAETMPPAERAAALYPAFRDPDPQWRIADQPYRRGAIDAWALVTQNTFADGLVASPLPQSTWALLFSNHHPNREQVLRSLKADSRGVSLSWLARETLLPLVRERRNRYEMFRLAQRVFSDAAEGTLPDVAIAVSGVRHSRALVLALERMQIREPGAWAAAVSAARHVTDASGDGHSAVVIFQATLALLERLRHARTLDVSTTERLLRSLSDAALSDRRVVRPVTAWIADTLIPALPALAAADVDADTGPKEAALIQALAGPVDRTMPTTTWEGLTYVVDPVAAEHDRLRDMRAVLPGPSLDDVLAADRPRELAATMMALVYMTALGDPEGPASLSPEVVTRHEFGLGGTTLIREELPWAPPEERQGNGPWRVQGSLLGLDLALSRLALRRIVDQQMPQAPTLTLNDLGTLTRTAVVMVPGDLADEDRDAIAAAIARGRERVAKARVLDDFLALARECGMPDLTQRVLPWMASRQPDALRDLFGLRDLLWLGHPTLPVERMDRWGVAGDALDGRRLTAMPGPTPWEDYAGRSEMGQVTTQVPDVTLRLVEETARLKLPAQLVPSLLAFALEDYWHDVQVRFADDWPRLTREAARITTERIHDYVAALAGGGPLRAH